MDFHHTSVLLQESVAALVTDKTGIYVDCTLGGGGHAARIVSIIGPSARFIGIDQDPAALEAGRQRLAGAKCRVDIVHNNFQNLDQILSELGINQADGILFDLGVSSHQLDVVERGFSYMHDAPLDMRMNPEEPLSAEYVVNAYSEDELARIIKDYGEERWARRIARFIVESRSHKPIKTTGELVDIIKGAIPASARREGPHPAKRTFQAIRIEVNSELSILKSTFTRAVERLRPGGRLCIITFHSLEDRIAKQTMQELAKGCICPPKIPICVCGRQPQLKILGRPFSPSAAEIAGNPRARSAKLRVGEKI